MRRAISFDPKMLPIVRKVCALGATDNEVADVLDIDRSTLYRWKHKHEDLSEAMRTGKDIADERVEQALYRKACGYTQTREKILVANGVVVKETFEDEIDPDLGAICFWLKNRKRQEWRMNQPVKFDLPKGASPHEKLEYVFEAVADGKVPAQDASALIQSVKAMLEVEEITVLKGKLEEMEKKLSGKSTR